MNSATAHFCRESPASFFSFSILFISFVLIHLQFYIQAGRVFSRSARGAISRKEEKTRQLQSFHSDLTKVGRSTFETSNNYALSFFSSWKPSIHILQNAPKKENQENRSFFFFPKKVVIILIRYHQIIVRFVQTIIYAIGHQPNIKVERATGKFEWKIMKVYLGFL